MVTADGKKLFNKINKPFVAMRYHSLAVSKETLPDCLEITAETEDGEIMGLRHKTHQTEGIQFHPESIMTPVGNDYYGILSILIWRAPMFKNLLSKIIRNENLNENEMSAMMTEIFSGNITDAQIGAFMGRWQPKAKHLKNSPEQQKPCDEKRTELKPRLR